jgi:aspartate kinase
MGCCSQRLVVIKLGGSVLVVEESYREAARFLVRRLHKRPEERLVVVVSARQAVTDELERVARGITGYPNPRTLDLLWSTGEMHSVALLTLHLEELGAAVVGLNVHETGLRFKGAGSVEAFRGEIRRALDDCDVVVVPGFFATLANGTLVSLGRGGSDLSAVLLAAELEAEQCDLIKDVPGYFTEDPNVQSRAEHLPWLSYEQALAMAHAGCGLVQQRAIETAHNVGLRLVVRSLNDDGPMSVVCENGNTTKPSGLCDSDRRV